MHEGQEATAIGANRKHSDSTLTTDIACQHTHSYGLDSWACMDSWLLMDLRSQLPLRLTVLCGFSRMREQTCWRHGANGSRHPLSMPRCMSAARADIVVSRRQMFIHPLQRNSNAAVAGKCVPGCIPGIHENGSDGG